VEHARGPRRARERSRRAGWVDKYGPPVRTKYRVIVENLSTRVSWQVSHGAQADLPIERQMECKDFFLSSSSSGF